MKSKAISCFVMQRLTIPEIIEDQWFQTNYEPAVHIECNENINLDDVHAAFSSIKVMTKAVK